MMKNNEFKEITTCSRFSKGLCSKFLWLYKFNLGLRCDEIENCNKKKDKLPMCKDCHYLKNDKCNNVHICVEHSRYKFKDLSNEYLDRIHK